MENEKEPKQAFIEVHDEDGKLIDRIPMSLADSDWIRAGRLAVKARAGDKNAAKALKIMQETEVYFYDSDDLNTPGLSPVEE